MMLSIIIPVLNEEKSIGRLLSDLKKCPISIEYEIIAVDDNSNDSTKDIILNEREKNKRIRLISSRGAHGLGKALKKGFKASSGAIIAMLTGDLSDNANDIPVMLKKICDDGYDFVCASRYSRGSLCKQSNIIKGFFSKYLGRAIHIFAGVPTLDSTNAYKMFKRRVLDDIGSLESERYTLGLELLLKSHKKGFKITEIPTTWHDREEGESHFKFLRDGFQYLKWFGFALFDKCERSA